MKVMWAIMGFVSVLTGARLAAAATCDSPEVKAQAVKFLTPDTSGGGNVELIKPAGRYWKIGEGAFALQTSSKVFSAVTIPSSATEGDGRVVVALPNGSTTVKILVCEYRRAETGKNSWSKFTAAELVKQGEFVGQLQAGANPDKRYVTVSFADKEASRMSDSRIFVAVIEKADTKPVSMILYANVRSASERPLPTIADVSEARKKILTAATDPTWKKYLYGTVYPELIRPFSQASWMLDNKLDCVNFVWINYMRGGVPYEFTNTTGFEKAPEFVRVTDPVPGDIIVWDKDWVAGSKYSGHVGIVAEVKDKAVTSFHHISRTGNPPSFYTAMAGEYSSTYQKYLVLRHKSLPAK